MTTIDNQLYDRMSDTWWGDGGFLNMSRLALNPARMRYFNRLINELNLDVKGKTALDIGCGGGALAEDFSKLGFAKVFAVDPSVKSIEVARERARKQNLPIEYQQSFAENLPFEDHTFDVVYCCDVLEHVKDLEKTVAEASRVLKPGGIYFYETINRTWMSYLVMIKMVQEWKATAFMPPNMHDWNLFIKPKELFSLMNKYGIENKHVIGVAPGASYPDLLTTMLDRAKGKMDFMEFGKRVEFKETRDMTSSYLGYGIKKN